MAEEKVCYIKVSGDLVEVIEEVYLDYYRAQRRWPAQDERDAYHGVVSYNAMNTDEILGVDAIPDSDAPSVEDMVEKRFHYENLHSCLARLSKAEQALIYALYYKQLSASAPRFLVFLRKP